MPTLGLRNWSNNWTLPSFAKWFCSRAFFFVKARPPPSFGSAPRASSMKCARVAPGWRSSLTAMDSSIPFLFSDTANGRARWKLPRARFFCAGHWTIPPTSFAFIRSLRSVSFEKRNESGSRVFDGHADGAEALSADDPVPQAPAGLGPRAGDARQAGDGDQSGFGDR